MARPSTLPTRSHAPGAGLGPRVALLAGHDIKKLLLATWKDLSQPPGIVVPRTAGALAIVVISLAAGHYLSTRVRQSLVRTRIGPNPSALLARVARVAVWIVGAVWILTVYSVPFTALAAIVSVAALALSLSFQDVLKNLIAGIYLLAERPFHIGDEITVSGVSGVIDDIEMRVTYLRTPLGERVVLPNQTVFTGVVVDRATAHGPPTSFTMEVPRTFDADGVERRVREALASHVTPDTAIGIDVTSITPECVTWTLAVELGPGARPGNALLAVANALPEATICLATGTTA